jgi:hypothetical protein
MILAKKEWKKLFGKTNEKTEMDKIMTDFINDDEHEISEYKKQIIVDNNDLLFGYITAEQAVAKFDSVKESIVTRIKNYEFEMQQYLSVVDNPIKQELLKKLRKNFIKNLIIRFLV